MSFLGEPKTTDYCLRCGESPDSGSHLFKCAYADPREPRFAVLDIKKGDTLALRDPEGLVPLRAEPEARVSVGVALEDAQRGERVRFMPGVVRYSEPFTFAPGPAPGTPVTVDGKPVGQVVSYEVGDPGGAAVPFVLRRAPESAPVMSKGGSATKTYVDGVARGLRIQGVVVTGGALPLDGRDGDAYYVEDEDRWYVRAVGDWLPIALAESEPAPEPEPPRLAALPTGAPMTGSFTVPEAGTYTFTFDARAEPGTYRFRLEMTKVETEEPSAAEPTEPGQRKIRFG